MLRGNTMDTTQPATLPRTRAALAALDAGHAAAADVADAFVAETRPYNREDVAREVAQSAAGLAWLRETFGGAR
jgi:hypothetical protein